MSEHLSIDFDICSQQIATDPRPAREASRPNVEGTAYSSAEALGEGEGCEFGWVAGTRPSQREGGRLRLEHQSPRFAIAADGDNSDTVPAAKSSLTLRLTALHEGGPAPKVRETQVAACPEGSTHGASRCGMLHRWEPAKKRRPTRVDESGFVKAARGADEAPQKH
jgi:hypothetical protein